MAGSFTVWLQVKVALGGIHHWPSISHLIAAERLQAFIDLGSHTNKGHDDGRPDLFGFG